MMQTADVERVVPRAAYYVHTVTSQLITEGDPENRQGLSRIVNQEFTALANEKFNQLSADQYGIPIGAMKAGLVEHAPDFLRSYRNKEATRPAINRFCASERNKGILVLGGGLVTGSVATFFGNSIIGLMAFGVSMFAITDVADRFAEDPGQYASLEREAFETRAVETFKTAAARY